MDIFEKAYNYKTANFVKELGLYNFFKVIQQSEGPRVTFDGKETIMIGSNNYLGLTHDPRVKEASIEAVKKYGTGCTGSRLLNGNLDLHMQLEHELAEFVGKEAAVVFSTGFFANQGTIETVCGKDDIIFSDSENHASIIAGCRMSRAQVMKFEHNDMNSLAEVLDSTDGDEGRLIVSDGVFSMGGDIVDLPGMVEAANATLGDKPRIMIDDAHGFGVIGKNGRGTASHYNLTDSVDLIMSTFSKSLASLGGFIAGDKIVMDFIKHTARSLIFTAAMPAGAAAAALKALELIRTEPERHKRLWENTHRVRKGFREIGLNTLHSETPIIPILCGDEGKALRIVTELFEKGVFATAVVFPAVAFGQAIIRTSFMATHSPEDIDKVVEVMAGISKKYNLPKATDEVIKPNKKSYNFKGVSKYTVVKAAFKTYLKTKTQRFYN